MAAARMWPRFLLLGSAALLLLLLSSLLQRPTPAFKDIVLFSPHAGSVGPEPRIAVVFWGLVRSVRKVAPSVRSVLARLRVLGNVTSFLHTYAFNGPYVNLWSGEYLADGLNHSDYTLLAPNVVAVDDMDTTRVALNLSSYHVPGRDPWKVPQAPWAAVDNFVLALYSLRRAMQLAIDAGPFDRVVFMRPDTWYANPDGIASCLFAAGPGVVSMPREARFGVVSLPDLLSNTLNQDVNDRFAVAAWDDAVAMGLRFDGLRDFAALHKPHSEGYLAALLNARGVLAVSCDFCMLRVRTNGTCKPLDVLQCVEERESLAVAPDTAARAAGYISAVTAVVCPAVQRSRLQSRSGAPGTRVPSLRCAASALIISYIGGRRGSPRGTSPATVLSSSCLVSLRLRLARRRRCGVTAVATEASSMRRT